MTGELVKFPIRLRVLHKMGLDFEDRQAVLDAEIRKTDRALAVLRRKRTLLLNAYAQEIQGKLAAGEAQP